MQRLFLGLSLIAILFQTSCADDNSHPFAPVVQNISERTGFEVRNDPQRPPEVDATVNDLLSRPLTLESATRIALLNNRELAATFEEVGIAQADYITAAQLKNPSLGIDARFPDKPPRGTDVEGSLMFNVVDLFMIGPRKKIAANQLDQATLRVSDAALQLVHDVRLRFYRYVAQEQIVDLARQMSESADTGAEFAQRQHDAGNIDDLNLVKQQAAASQVKLEEMQAESDLLADRESLNQLLGLSGVQTSWSAAAPLSPLPAALNQIPATDPRRLDLEIARQQVALADRAVSYTKGGIFTEVTLGPSFERDTNGQTVTGPAISLELPIFNQHQGQVSRAEAELRQARKNLDAVSLRIESEVRLAKAKVEATWRAADLANNTLVPARSRAVSLTQLQYNGMLSGQYALLEAKNEELAARRQAVELLRDYWTARAQLDRALGD